MDPRSETNLSQVRPKLADVIRAAAQSPQPFVVTYGIRTLEAEKEALASGHSMTLHSRHLPTHADPFCAAVDITPLVDGELSFCAGHEAEVYGQVAVQIKEAAAKAGIKIQWGGDWISFKDWGHFQLPWLTDP